jgi:NADH-quinone oxidoreductase subunit M
MKYLIGYSSVSHMGLVSMGFAAMTLAGFTGAGLQMVSHGVMTSLFFSVVGMIYDRAHTRDMDELSGMKKALPWTVFAFIIGGLVSMGMPGLSGFIAEFPIFLGVWNGGNISLSGTAFGLNPANFYPIVAILSVIAIVVTAGYVLRATHKVFFGEYDEHKWHDMRPLLTIDKLVLVGFSVILVVIGIYPAVIAPIVQSGVTPVVARIQEAQQAVQFQGGDVAAATGDALRFVAVNVLTWLGGA